MTDLPPGVPPLPVLTERQKAIIHTVIALHLAKHLLGGRTRHGHVKHLRDRLRHLTRRAS